jgi:membrane protein implicated in regulation of membrane protease activity
MQCEWWYWIIAGFCLIGLEFIVPSFTIIWFGMAALTVGVLIALLPTMPLAGQIVLWSATSIAYTVMWHKYLKPKNTRNHSGSHPWIMGKG